MFFWKKDKSKNFDKLSKSEKETLARELLEEGNRALEKGKQGAALESFRRLVRLDPSDPDHRRRLADCHGRLGDKKSELEARCKAATLYAEAGFLLKGVAMCKLALAIDPTHQQTQKQLAELNELTGNARPVMPVRRQQSEREEDDRKTRALAEARARVERVRVEREKAEAARRAAADKAATEKSVATQAQKAQDAPPAQPAPPAPPVPSTAGEPPTKSSSFASGAPLESVPLKSVLPNLQGESPGASSDLSSEDDEDDIFIAPLDEDELEDNGAAGPVEENIPAGTSEDGLRSALKRVPLLSDLSQKSFITLVQEVSFCQMAKGDVLFEVGDPADAMYCVVEGEVAARLPSPFGEDLELARLGEGEFFGEIGLLAEQPRKATIAATQDSILLVFERNIVAALGKSEPHFIKILLRFVRERLVASLIATNPLFAPFAGPEADDLTKRFQFLEVKARKPLVRQGTPSSGVFILLTGGARVVHSAEGEVRELGELGPGDIFGEMSLINRQDAVASVVTTEKSYVLELPAKDFTQLVMMHPALLAYVSSLALERQANNEALLSGVAGFREDSLSLM